MTPTTTEEFTHLRAGSDVWDRTIAGWHVAFAGVLAIGVLRVVIAVDQSPAERLACAGLLGVLALGYLVARDGHQDPGTWRAHTYLGVAVAVTGFACWLDGALSLLLFIVYPQVWLLSRDLRTGTAVTVALTISATAGLLAAEGWSPEALRVGGPQMLVGMLFSLLLGYWIARIMRESQQRAQLISQLESARAALAAAHHAQGVMAERERMAREIHDTLAQGFTSVVMLAQAATAGLERSDCRDRGAQAARERLRAIEDVARENLAEARSLVAALAPVGLADATLPDALRRLADRFGAETGLTVDIRVDGETSGLGRAQEVVLLRAAQEALTNVRRHARAERVVVRLLADAEGVRIEIDDDGVGFATDGVGLATDGAVGGFGLSGMRGRVGEIGGEMDVTSRPGQGTRVSVRVPTGGQEPG